MHLQKKKPLYIYVNGSESDPCITVSNNRQHKNLIETSSRTGLANLNERYRIMGAPEPEIKEDDAHFTVKISVLRK